MAWCLIKQEIDFHVVILSLSERQIVMVWCLMKQETGLLGVVLN
jgi:hypothetical protein